MILDFCQNTESRNPIAMLQQMMARPEIYMHGPEHHVMVGAALLAAYRNCGGRVDLSAALPEMVRRGQQVPGGACGFWGAVVLVSVPAFLSVSSPRQRLWRRNPGGWPIR